jgi:hypothetical protein
VVIHVRFTPEADIVSVSGMSVLCQKLTRAANPLPNDSLFDHLVGASKERLRNAQTESLDGFEIDDKFVFGRRLMPLLPLLTVM